MNEINFDISEAKFKPLRAFTMHGAGLYTITGNQVFGDCPFCGKEGHFFVNWEKLLWDCKVCGEKGNRQSFLEKVNNRNIASFNNLKKRILADDRKLPTDAFDWVELGYHRNQYTIAIRDSYGKLTDLRVYKIGGKAMSTAGSKASMFGLAEFLKSKSSLVYICEGEWDTIAMQWLLKTTGNPGKAVCSPGAGTFKPEWSDYFQGKDVVVAYDNDLAGFKGEETVINRLVKRAKSMKFVHWTVGSPDGYDLRDFITKKAVEKKAPKKCFELLNNLIKTTPRVSASGEVIEMMGEKGTPEVDPSVNIHDVFKVFEELLHEPNRMGIELAIITMLASAYKTDPIWTFLVAPPSSGKTAILNSLKYLSEPYDEKAIFVSHISTHSLISGMETKRGDPSLFAQLNGTNKALVIKDFTPVISMRPQDKDDLYGQFRDAYDGYTSKIFGNGITRQYDKLKFNVIAGVTDSIYDESNNFQSLGERFAKLNIGRGNDIEFSKKAIERSYETRDEFEKMEDNVAKTVYSCVKNLIKKAEEEGLKLPPLSAELKKALTGVSLYVAAMRGVVSRDKYRRDYIKSAPSADMGIRNSKLLAAIASLHAAIYGRKEATLEDFPIVRKIALDTINQRDEELLRSIYDMENNKSEANKARVQMKTRYTPYTVRCIMEDFVMLDILEKKQEGKRYFYVLSNRMKLIIKESKLYDKLEEIQEPKVKIKIKVKKGK